MKKAKAINMVKDVKFLTEIQPTRNFQNPQSLQKVVDYISKHMADSGFTPELQSWQAEAEGYSNEYSNVICCYQPEKQKRLIIGAHYDVCCETPGADDNASAVSGLLETIRIIGAEKPKLDFGIDFVAYCLEEPPFYGTNKMGSYVHAKSISGNKENIIGMICFEMIGYFSDSPGSQNYPNEALRLMYPSVGNFITAVGIEKYADFNNLIYKGMKKGAKINVEKINMPSGLGLADMSDQRNYWKFGIPGMMINDTAFLRNPNYHQMTDTMDTLDYTKMAEVVNCTVNAVLNI